MTGITLWHPKADWMDGHFPTDEEDYWEDLAPSVSHVG